MRKAIARLGQDKPSAVLLLLLVAGLALVCLAVLGQGPSAPVLGVAGATAILLGLGLSILGGDGTDRHLGALLADDPVPAFVTDRKGRLVLTNRAARNFAGTDYGGIAAALGTHLADPGAALLRLQARAEADGAAQDLLTARSGSLRVAVHRVGGRRFLWRIERLGDWAHGQTGADGLSLPMLTANSAGIVLFANEAMRRLLGERPRRLAQCLPDPPMPDGLVDVASRNGPLRARMVDLAAAGGRREIYLMPLDPPAAAPSLRISMDDMPVPMLRFDATGVLRAANRAACDLIGGDRAGARVGELFDGLGRPVKDWLADVARGRHPGGSEVLQLLGAERETFAQVSLSRMAGHGDVMGGDVLAILQDATALKRIEAQYVQSQKMHAIGQLAGGIAHDFNNLLTAISGHCDLLLLRRRAGGPDHADLLQIRQNTNRAAALVAQLLAFSRKQSMTPERLDLPEVLADCSHLLTRLLGERIDLRVTHDPEIGPVRADRRQVEQVVINLVVNARDAMPEGGVVRIDTQDRSINADLPHGRATVPAGRYAVIRVRDDGVGIPPDRLDKIFEPFFTTKRTGEGTGLGLSTVYGIVKQSGGFIFVDSEPGQGSTFEVWLPVNDGGPVPQTAPVPDAPTGLMRKSEGVVLLVEDEPPVRAFAARALRLRGHSVLEAETAEEALHILEDDALHVDVFVTDVVMPGLDGPAWVRQALERRPGVRVVFVSGYAEDCLDDLTEDMPGSVFLPKPFTLADLAKTVQHQMERAPEAVAEPA